jgi:hypothetical protein
MGKVVMAAAKITKSKRRFQTLQRQLASAEPLMRNTIISNGKRHPQPYSFLNQDKRTYLKYLAASCRYRPLQLQRAISPTKWGITCLT